MNQNGRANKGLNSIRRGFNIVLLFNFTLFSHMPSFTPGSTPAYRSVMFFIDGGYLRNSLKSMTGGERAVNFEGLPHKLNREFIRGRLRGEIIRVYYYDAICEPEDSEYTEQKQFFEGLNNIPFVEVKLANLVKLDSGYRQKGVDVLLAVDVITKAYENHFDIAILLVGDRDFLPLVKAVKNLSGKRVFGVVFEKHYSEQLYREFDKRLILTKENIHKFL